MDEYIRFNGSRVKNIQNKHFGHLIPQKIVGIKNKYAVWECLCDLCGGTREVSAKHLNSGSTAMCESCAKKNKAELNTKRSKENTNKIVAKELARKKFGFWEAVKKGEIISGVQMWECKCCKCGAVKNISVYKLVSGNVPECECAKVRDLIGRHFGMLEVVAVSKKGALSYVCKCDCGNTIKCTARDLSWRRSCGCSREIEQKKHTKSYIVLKGQKMRSDNKSGVIGVHRANGKWGAAITFQKKSYWLGTFNTIKDAAEARKEAEKHLYKDFLIWYEDTYPNARKNRN